MNKGTSKKGFTRSISEALGLPRTAEKIMDSLARAGRYLPVKELVKRVQMSERSVRKHLMILIKRGILSRRAVQNGTRRVTYEYSLRPAQELLGAARRDFSITMQKLEKVVRRLGTGRAKRTSPKSASSWRN